MSRYWLLIFWFFLSENLLGQQHSYSIDHHDSAYIQKDILIHKIKKIKYKRVAYNPGYDKYDTSHSVRKFDRAGRLVKLTHTNLCGTEEDCDVNQFATINYDAEGNVILSEYTETTPRKYIKELINISNTTVNGINLKEVQHTTTVDTVTNDVIYWYDTAGKLVAEKGDLWGYDSLWKSFFTSGNVKEEKYFYLNKIKWRHQYNESGKLLKYWVPYKDSLYLSFINYYEHDSLVLYDIHYFDKNNQNQYGYPLIKKYIRDSIGTLLEIEEYQVAEFTTDTSVADLLKIAKFNNRQIASKLEFYPDGKVKKHWHNKLNYHDTSLYYYLDTFQYGGDSILRWTFLFYRTLEKIDSAVSSFAVSYKDTKISDSCYYIHYIPSQCKSDYTEYYPDGKIKYQLARGFKEVWYHPNGKKSLKKVYTRDGGSVTEYDSFGHELSFRATTIKKGKPFILSKKSIYDSLGRKTREIYDYKDSITYENTYQYNADDFLVKEVNNHQGYTRQLFFNAAGLPVRREYISEYGETTTETWEYEFY